MKSKKIKSFEIKNCEMCQFYRTTIMYKRKQFCGSHETDTPISINKEIKKEQKYLVKWRIFFWIFIALLTFVLLFSIYELFFRFSKSSELDNFLTIRNLISCGVYLPVLIYYLNDNEKSQQKTLKELNQKKNDWIIEYEDFPKKKKNRINYFYKKSSFSELSISLFKRKINWSELNGWEKFLVFPLFLLVFAWCLVWFIIISPVILIRLLFFKKETTKIKKIKRQGGSVYTIKSKRITF